MIARQEPRQHQYAPLLAEPVRRGVVTRQPQWAGRGLVLTAAAALLAELEAGRAP